MAAKNYAVIDKNQWNVYIQVPAVFLGIICLTIFAFFFEEIRKEAVVGVLGLVALLSKGPGYKNAAKSVVKNGKEEDDEIAVEIFHDLVKKMPVDKLAKLIMQLPNESKEKIQTSSHPVTPDDSSSSETKNQNDKQEKIIQDE
jgi:hypothetical protein